MEEQIQKELEEQQQFSRDATGGGRSRSLWVPSTGPSSPCATGNSRKASGGIKDGSSVLKSYSKQQQQPPSIQSEPVVPLGVSRTLLFNRDTSSDKQQPQRLRQIGQVPKQNKTHNDSRLGTSNQIYNRHEKQHQYYNKRDRQAAETLLQRTLASVTLNSENNSGLSSITADSNHRTYRVPSRDPFAVVSGCFLSRPAGIDKWQISGDAISAFLSDQSLKTSPLAKECGMIFSVLGRKKSGKSFIITELATKLLHQGDKHRVPSTEFRKYRNNGVQFLKLPSGHIFLDSMGLREPKSGASLGPQDSDIVRYLVEGSHVILLVYKCYPSIEDNRIFECIQTINSALPQPRSIIRVLNNSELTRIAPSNAHNYKRTPLDSGASFCNLPHIGNGSDDYSKSEFQEYLRLILSNACESAARLAFPLAQSRNNHMGCVDAKDDMSSESLSAWMNGWLERVKEREASP